MWLWDLSVNSRISSFIFHVGYLHVINCLSVFDSGVEVCGSIVEFSSSIFVVGFPTKNKRAQKPCKEKKCRRFCLPYNLVIRFHCHNVQCPDA